MICDVLTGEPALSFMKCRIWKKSPVQYNLVLFLQPKNLIPPKVLFLKLADRSF
jgi:hypothetical protein